MKFIEATVDPIAWLSSRLKRWGAYLAHTLPVVPAKAGIHFSAIVLSEAWIPTFVGMTSKWGAP
jgi:hypothetical protein